MSTLLKKALSLFQFLPLFLFMYTLGFFMSWEAAFEFAGIAAVVIITFLFFAKIRMDNLMVGVCLFMIIGAAMFFFNIEFLDQIYSHYMEAALFTSVFLVGVLATFISPAGFIGVTGESRWVRRSSIYLLLSVVGAVFISYFMRGEGMTGFAVPWFIILSARYLLR
jgi:hypothetical protein